jgi:hypothetical protein
MNSSTKCQLCGNLNDGSSCTPKTVIGKNEYNRIPYGIEAVLAKVQDETDKQSHCHDCNVHFNGFHHFPCEVEICPRCSGQFISCGCGVV